MENLRAQISLDSRIHKIIAKKAIFQTDASVGVVLMLRIYTAGVHKRERERDGRYGFSKSEQGGR